MHDGHRTDTHPPARSGRRLARAVPAAALLVALLGAGGCSAG
ncbi:DUF4349 domain-containing protein, partial [Streptomyces sp. SID4940]